MNPRQRRGVLLIAMSAVGLIMVFVLVAGYVADVRKEVDPKIGVLRLDENVARNQPIGDDATRLVQVPERYAPPRALRDRSALTGLVAGTDLPRGSVLQQGMAVAPPELESGQREIAILVDAETGVAGKIRPTDLVDVVATFDGDRSTNNRPQAQIIVSSARVLNVGAVTTRDRGPDTTAQGAGQAPAGQTVPVTFALSVQNALTVTYAESFAQEVRLALTRPGDTERVPADKRVFPPN